MAKILIVEDDPLVASTLRLVLHRAGHQLSPVANGSHAIAAFRNGRFDLVITDIIMPEMGGIELIRALRGLAPDIRIIAISGGGRTQNCELLRLALKHGATGIVRKPFANTELVAVVARALTAPYRRHDGLGASNIAGAPMINA